MPGMGTSTQTQSTQSQTAPWAPAQPALQAILSGINSQLPNYRTNPAQQSALTALAGNASNLPSFQQPATNLATSYLGGDPTGLLNPALMNYQKTMQPIANASLDPTQTPGMQGLLSTIRNDVSNSVNGQFAGAGRDLSGLNQQTLARGIAQGEAAPLLDQYNRNVSNVMGASGGLLGASGTVSSAITGNQNQGLGVAQNLPGFAAEVPNAQLAAQQAAFGLPLNNLGAFENLTLPIAGLGGQSSGTSQGSYTMSPIQQMIGLSQALGGSGGGGLLGNAGTGLGALSQIPGLNFLSSFAAAL